MDRQKITLYAGIGIIFIFLLFLLSKRTNNYSWREHYKQNSKDPYGTMFVSKLLDESLGEDTLTILKDTLSKTLPTETTTPSNYVFIGEAMYMTPDDVGQLLGFVESGNTAFISCRVIPYDLMFHLYYEECDSLYWDGLTFLQDTQVNLNFTHPDLQLDSAFACQYYYQKVKERYEWQYIEDAYFCENDLGLIKLGQINDTRVNFARVKYGDGYFYIHTTPLTFTNLHLLYEEGTDYASRTFSHLLKGPTYWDEYSRISAQLGQRLNNRPDRRLNSKSPLQFILNQPPLTWAWYILLAMGLLFLIFRAKRKQRIIPVLEPNQNTSLQFVSTIGRLYFLQSNHKQLALQKMKFLQVFIREKYHLPSRTLDQELAQKLAVRSEVPLEVIEQIRTLFHNIKSASFVSENTLIQFHKLLEEFYQNCK